MVSGENIDPNMTILNIRNIRFQFRPRFFQAFPRRYVIAPAVVGTGDHSALYLPLGNRLLHMLAVPFHAKQFAIQLEYGNTLGKNRDHPGVTFFQFRFLTDFDTHSYFQLPRLRAEMYHIITEIEILRIIILRKLLDELELVLEKIVVTSLDISEIHHH